MTIFKLIIPLRSSRGRTMQPSGLVINKGIKRNYSFNIQLKWIEVSSWNGFIRQLQFRFQFEKPQFKY